MSPPLLMRRPDVCRAPMQIHTSHVGLNAAAYGMSVAIGQFDGFHRGHCAVVSLAAQHAKKIGCGLGVLTFDPSPAQYFAADAALERLMSPAQRVQLAAELSVDHLLVLPFDASMAQRSAQTFIESILVDALQVCAVSVGTDFRFGAGRKGDRDTLAMSGRRDGFEVLVADVSCHGSRRVSSSWIRDCIARGDMSLAAQLLGRPWTVEGTVLQGKKRGRTIGFPTANIDPGDYARPAHGVYAVWAGLTAEQTWYPAIANYGRAPTLGQRKAFLEVHVFDHDSDLYGKPLSVAFSDHIRSERTFASVDDLAAQIDSDSMIARARLDQQTPPPMAPMATHD